MGDHCVDDCTHSCTGYITSLNLHVKMLCLLCIVLYILQCTITILSLETGYDLFVDDKDDDTRKYISNNLSFLTPVINGDVAQW